MISPRSPHDPRLVLSPPSLDTISPQSRQVRVPTIVSALRAAAAARGLDAAITFATGGTIEVDDADQGEIARGWAVSSAGSGSQDHTRDEMRSRQRQLSTETSGSRRSRSRQLGTSDSPHRQQAAAAAGRRPKGKSAVDGKGTSGGRGGRAAEMRPTTGAGKGGRGGRGGGARKAGGGGGQRSSGGAIRSGRTASSGRVAGGEASILADAMRVARAADVIVAALGDTVGTAAEWADRSSLELAGTQPALLAALSSLGKPLVLVLVRRQRTGRRRGRHQRRSR